MAGFIYKLQNIVNTTPDNYDLDVNIARCLLKNINQIKKGTSLQEIANLCYTSQSSMSRFSQRLNYESFNDFKTDCLNVQSELQELMIDNHANQKMDIGEYVKDINQCLVTMGEMFSMEEIDQLCQHIEKAQRIYIFATHIPGDLAHILQHALLTTGKYVEFYPRREHQMKVAQQIKKDDLCIFISLEGTLLMEKLITIPAITSQATTVLITQNVYIKFSERFTQVIGLGEHDREQVGKYKLLLWIDCLLNHYYHDYI